jgi:uncharacterized protein (TIGR03790 family)
MRTTQLSGTSLQDGFGVRPSPCGATSAIIVGSELLGLSATAWTAAAGARHIAPVEALPDRLPLSLQASQLLRLLRPMCVSGLRSLCVVAMLLGVNWFAGSALAGGSGLNTLVVINQNSSNSIALGNYYAERRQVPPENILRIAWSGGNISWDGTQFQTNLLQPLLSAISSRGLSNQIHYVVLSMDIPYSTSRSNVFNGTTSGLFYGLKTGGGLNAYMLTNSYSDSESAFSDAKPAAAEGHSFLATMLTAGSLTQAKSLVDQGVDSDSTFPTAPVVLAKTYDPLRRIRYTMFDNAMFNTRLRGNYSLIRKNANSMYGETNLLGYQTGLMTLSVPANVFAPGAMADSLTSYAGVIFGYNEQTSLLAFIHGGAAGSYGTVAEPTANAAKFPNPQNYFFQSRGFSLAECYYQSLDVPYQGLIVGEPLAAPFAVAASGSWSGVAPDELLVGTRPLVVQFTAADATRPLARIDLFVDGKFFQTLTNVTPAAGNQLSVRLGNLTINQTVPANATLTSLATALAATLNSPANSNSTRTAAQAFGDRVELRFTGGNRPLSPINLRVTIESSVNQLVSDSPAFTTSTGSASARTTFLAARPTFLDSPAHGIKSLAVGGSVQAGTWLRLTVTKTNGAVVVVTYTNPTAGPSPGTVLSNLVNLINAEPALAGADGVMVEDFTIPSFGNPFANLLARSPGLAAAGVRASLTSSSMGTAPNTLVTLTDNLADLQPRNHLYLTTGAPVLGGSFSLNTTSVADGFHELTAVAYEGSSVRTQTRVTIPVRVQNTPLSASLTLVNLAATNPVSGNYQIAVTANTNNISNITLYTTGGALGAVNNQPGGTFAVSGAALGVGRHPFYAMVQDALGRRYRTATSWVRFE